MNKQNLFLLIAAVMGSGLITGSSALARSDMPSTNQVPSSLAWHLPTLSSWWNGTNADANWIGLAPVMKHYGLSITGAASEVSFGQVSGGFPSSSGQPTSTFIPVVKLKGTYDFSKLIPELDGLTFVSTWRYRGVGGNFPGYAAGTTGLTYNWAPSDANSGWGMRMLQQMLEYTTPNKVWTINAGMENPYDQFLQQPLSKTFQNNMVVGTKGIGMQAGPGFPITGGYAGGANSANNLPRNYGAYGVGWSSSYLAWGGTLKVKPTKTVYFMTGLYEAVAGDTGVNPTQFNATSVYPYTSVPQSYLGQFKSSGQVVPVVGGNGQLIPGASQNLGWVPAYENNHGFNTAGAPSFSYPAAYVNVKPTTATGGTIYGTANGASTYKNSAGQTVASPAYYANSPYNQGGVGGNYSGNGLFNMNELGWTPKLGADKLEGHYAIGSYIWGLPNYSYTPTTYTATVYNPKTGNVATANYSTKPFQSSYNGAAIGMYLQADQMLFRVHESTEDQASYSYEGKNVVDKNTDHVAHSLSDRGLYIFNEVSLTPPQNNFMPVYFQTGLSFTGLFACRPHDQLAAVVGAGFYSSYFNSYQQTQNAAYENAVTSAYNATVPNGPTQAQKVNPTTGNLGGAYSNFYAYAPNYTSTEVIEAHYQVQINKWMDFQPYVQCIVNPAGNGTVNNDWIMGARAQVVF